MAPGVRRRTLLAAGLSSAGWASSLPAAIHASPTFLVENITRLYPVRVTQVARPASTDETQRVVAAWPGQVAVGGGRYSMGGQIAIEGGLHIDMRAMNALVWIKPRELAVRVQAGMRWRDLQDLLDPLGLAVRTMQSYSNFTVGGSVSVNAHGRYVGHGPVSRSVRAVQIVLASGEVIEASRERNARLFNAALGGYGGLGVITEVELRLDRNSRIERSTARVRLADYAGYFRRKVESGGSCLLHNADLLPPRFDQAMVVNWSITDKPVTISDRLVPRGRAYTMDQYAIRAVTELPGGAGLQSNVIRPALLGKPAVVWRNYEASLDVGSLEPKSRVSSTYVLQEYFVPVRHFASFAARMAQTIRRHDALVLNVSVRHSPADVDVVMAWAREEVFSFVVYFKQKVDRQAIEQVQLWTREMIAVALAHEGSYYLPYQRHATQAQFDAAYPQKELFKQIKAEFDPSGRMSNELWKQYL